MLLRWFQSLAVRTASITAGVTFLAGAALSIFVPWVSLALVSVTAGITFLTTFGVMQLSLAPRIAAARRQIDRIRRGNLDELEPYESAGNDELDDLGREAFEAASEVRRRMRELNRTDNYRKEFLGNVSHELQTPIFAIQGFAETLRDGALNDPEVNHVFVERILRNTERLGALTRDLVDISRLETGTLTMATEPVDLDELSREVFDALEMRATSRNITLRRNVPVGLPTVLGDRQYIGQVLTNLIDNAVKYTDSGGEVTFEAVRNGDTVSIIVRDTGVGIDAAHIPRLTERFFRVDKGRGRDDGGTGIGLAIVKHILAAHQTRLNVWSTPGEGSSFSFELPAHELADRSEQTGDRGYQER